MTTTLLEVLEREITSKARELVIANLELYANRCTLDGLRSVITPNEAQSLVIEELHHHADVREYLINKYLDENRALVYKMVGAKFDRFLQEMLTTKNIQQHVFTGMDVKIPRYPNSNLS